jgi:hypothetical protein
MSHPLQYHGDYYKLITDNSVDEPPGIAQVVDLEVLDPVFPNIFFRYELQTHSFANERVFLKFVYGP